MKPFAAALGLALSAASPAFATTTFDFEAVTSFESIADFYNGGTDGAGKTGPSLGVSFGGDAQGLANDIVTTYFSNAPTPLGVLAPVGADSALNAAGGFADALSFFYSSTAAVSQGVQVWSGLNGTGSLLASFDLAANAQLGCNDSLYCHFDVLTGGFSGTARSITFGNAVGVAFDNVTIAAVPEPATVAMMAIGLVALGAVARRRRG